MIKTTDKADIYPIYSNKRRLVSIAFLLAMLLWCLFLLTALTIGGLNILQFTSSSAARIFSALAAIGLVISSCYIFDFVSDRLLRLSGRGRLALLYGIAAAVAVVMAVRTPFSPGNDAYDLLTFLNYHLKGTQTQYSLTYQAAYAENRLVIYMYVPLSRLSGGAVWGVRATNFIFMTGGIFFISSSCRRIYGEGAAEASVFSLAVLFPYLLLTGPYIYLPSIFLSALAFWLFHGKTVYSKILFVTVIGILYTLRPMACAFLLVYAVSGRWFAKNKRHANTRAILNTCLIVLCCILVKNAVGFALYKTGLHPYPALGSSATVWTLETGTRPNGDATGICSYSPYSEGFDEISDDFHKLWKLHMENSGESYGQIKLLKGEIFNKIVRRSMETSFLSIESAAGFFGAKFKNYYSDMYRPYYYAANIENAASGQNIYRNYEKRFFLYENLLLIIFYLCAAGALIYSVSRKRYQPFDAGATISLILGVAAASVFAIMFTEVGKRLIFDCFTPMAVVISGGMLRTAAALREKSARLIRNENVYFSVPVLFLACFTALVFLYGMFNIKPFKNSRARVTDDTVVIEFESEIKQSGYSVSVLSTGEEISLYGKKSIRFYHSTSYGDIMRINIPNGEKYTVYRYFIP